MTLCYSEIIGHSSRGGRNVKPSTLFWGHGAGILGTWPAPSPTLPCWGILVTVLHWAGGHNKSQPISRYPAQASHVLGFPASCSYQHISTFQLCEPMLTMVLLEMLSPYSLCYQSNPVHLSRTDSSERASFHDAASTQHHLLHSTLRFLLCGTNTFCLILQSGTFIPFLTVSFLRTRRVACLFSHFSKSI